ncbi:MAG: hypothetical protein NT010_13080 [Proteobacteria bacterium]|nr:hypothetical protein [Pseudomonadota bacterium]
MLKFSVINPIKLKTQRGLEVFPSGAVIFPKKVEPLLKLLEAGRIKPAQSCPICKSYRWWLSIHGSLVCGLCHPPASEGIVKMYFYERSIRQS